MNYPMTLLAYYAGEKVLSVLLIILMLSIVLLLFSLPWIDWFRQELKYINTEIERNVDHPREQARWKRRKRRLLLSLIPFVKYE